MKTRSLYLTILPTLAAAILTQQPLAAAEEPADAAAIFDEGCECAREGDKARAAELLRQAAELGYPRAGLVYGIWCFAEHHYEPALLYLVPEAAKGQADALFCLGYMHYKGWGVPESQEDARPLLEQAAAAGHPQACALLAQLLLQAEEPDTAAAQELLARATAAAEEESDDTAPEEEDGDSEDEPTTEDEGEQESDDTEPQEEDGDGDDEPTTEDVESEESKEFIAELLSQSELNLPAAERLLGYMKLRGIGSAESPEAAFALLINAAKTGDSDSTAEQTVALLYRHGIGIEANAASADEWEARVAPELRERLAACVAAYLQADTEAKARLALRDLLRAADLPTAADDETAAAKRALVETAMLLPPYTLHEESRTQFREQLESGDYWEEAGKRYLSFGGDGSAGKFIFVQSEQGDICVVQEDWEEGTYTVLRYDARKQELVPLLTLRKELLAD